MLIERDEAPGAHRLGAAGGAGAGVDIAGATSSSASVMDSSGRAG